jgi:hypothetical protein
MNSRLFGTVAVVAGLAFAGTAVAQNSLTNPGFEDPDPVFSSDPEGWNPITGGGFALEWTDIGDPGAQVRTGNKSIKLGAPDFSSGAFIGWSTNIFDQGGMLYDPPYVYQGGDLYVSGYYNIPTGSELGPIGGSPNDLVGIKLELRRVPPNFSIYEAFEFPFSDVATDGSWVRFDIVLTEAMVGDFPEKPGSVTILPFRFDGEGDAIGTIYLDDLCVNQGSPACPEDPGCGIADVTTTGAGAGDPGFGVPDGEVTGADIQYFVNFWVAGDVSVADVTTTGAGAGDPGFGVPDGQVTGADIQYFVNFWVLGCP